MFSAIFVDRPRLAIVIAIYRNKHTPLVDEYDSMKQ